METTIDAGVLEIATDAGTLHIDALSDDVMRVRHVRPGESLPDRVSYALDPDARWDAPSWEVREHDGTVTIETATLAIAVDRASGAMTVTDRTSGETLVESGPLAADRVAHEVALAPADRLFGLGDKALALDRRGHAVEMWNTDAFKYQRGTDPLYKSVPLVVKQGDGAAVGLFYDNAYRSRFDLGASDSDQMRWEADGGALDLYVLRGPTALDVTRRYARLTGRTPMLPKWALGYHQCRYSYRSDADVREIARQFRERRIPCDALYFDIHYMRGYRVFTWDREQFPDPPGLLADLAGDGFRSIVIVDPGVKADDPEYDVYREGADRDAYVRYPDGQEVRGEVWPGTCAFPDFTDPSVRRWWGELHQEYLAQGVDGVWNDMNEPALFSVAHVEGSMDAETEVGTIPDHALHDFDGAGGTHAEGHNVYGMQMQRATFEGLTRLAPDKRPFIITRASYAGGQRFGISWTGDNTATWAHLRLSVETCLSLGVSGMTVTGADVGGFVGTPTGELMARWTQVGALTPLFRNHSAIDTPRQEPWLFGDEVERVCREAIELRYRLLPVLYTALWQAATDGTPMLRPLPLVHPTDATIRATDPPQFYLGADLLAAPVVADGQREGEVYLPANPGGWYDLASGDRYGDRQTVWIDTPLDRIPLFARAGSVVPLAPVRQHTGEPAGRLTLHVFPAPGHHTSRLYEDAGDGHGPHVEYTLAVEDDGDRIVVSAREGGTGFVPEWTGWDVVVHGLDAAPAQVFVDGEEAAAAFDGAVRVTVGLGQRVEVVR
ncbi:glycoside hydrolase family 31 protein [Rubrivirga sp. IMCC45206]|uniref:glycoside hydrolase family 31 protein n=1 Tax=Rubrivirga sp. IMCC45206 TaxID=3391614 RepID=UPI00398FE988